MKPEYKYDTYLQGWITSICWQPCSDVFVLSSGVGYVVVRSWRRIWQWIRFLEAYCSRQARLDIIRVGGRSRVRLVSKRDTMMKHRFPFSLLAPDFVQYSFSSFMLRDLTSEVEFICSWVESFNTSVLEFPLDNEISVLHITSVKCRNFVPPVSSSCPWFQTTKWSSRSRLTHGVCMWRGWITGALDLLFSPELELLCLYLS